MCQEYRPFTALYKGDYGFQALIRVLFRERSPYDPDRPLGLLGSLYSSERIVMTICVMAIVLIAIRYTFKLRGFPTDIRST